MNKDKELEEAKIRLIRDITKPLACGDVCIVSISDVETVLQELDNKEKEIQDLKSVNAMQEYRINEMDIPKKLIEDSLEMTVEKYNKAIAKLDLNKEYLNVSTSLYEAIRLEVKKQILQELLEINKK